MYWYWWVYNLHGCLELLVSGENRVISITSDFCPALSLARAGPTPCSYFRSLGSCCRGHSEMLSDKGWAGKEAGWWNAVSEINGLYLTFPFFSFFFSFGSINMWRSCNKNSCHLSNAYSAPSRLLGLLCMWGGGELHEEQRGICVLSGKVSGCSFLGPGPFTPGRPVRIIQISGLLAEFRSHSVSISPSFLQPFFSRKHKSYLH